jgi:DNA polymerase elongation subunit (family B)
MKAFYKQPLDDLLYLMKDELNRLCDRSVVAKDLTISKSVGDIKDYKIRAFPDDDKKLQKRLMELDIFDTRADLSVLRTIFKSFLDREEDWDGKTLEHLVVREYIGKALPSQVQLAEKMRKRGTRVDVGERLGYVVIESDNNIKDKLFNKIEDVDYFKENSSLLRIDSLYYSKLMINPMDEVLSAVYKQTDLFKKYYKYREHYWKVVRQLNELFSPKIIFL